VHNRAGTNSHVSARSFAGKEIVFFPNEPGKLFESVSARSVVGESNVFSKRTQGAVENKGQDPPKLRFSGVFLGFWRALDAGQRPPQFQGRRAA
jgi:hypothetical protein